MTQDMIDALASLLSQAGAAHGVFEESELRGVYDQSWPDWYAGWLIEHGLGGHLPRPLDWAALALFLKGCDEAYKRERPSEAWPSFYARRFLAG
jgi:hypothetical protein